MLENPGFAAFSQSSAAAQPKGPATSSSGRSRLKNEEVGDGESGHSVCAYV